MKLTKMQEILEQHGFETSGSNSGFNFSGVINDIPVTVILDRRNSKVQITKTLRAGTDKEYTSICSEALKDIRITEVRGTSGKIQSSFTLGAMLKVTFGFDAEGNSLLNLK